MICKIPDSEDYYKLTHKPKWLCGIVAAQLNLECTLAVSLANALVSMQQCMATMSCACASLELICTSSVWVVAGSL